LAEKENLIKKLQEEIENLEEFKKKIDVMPEFSELEEQIKNLEKKLEEL